MRTPKEVLIAITKELGKNPYMASTEDLMNDITKQQKIIDKAIERRKQMEERLKSKLNYDKEMANTLAYLEELK